MAKIIVVDDEPFQLIFMRTGATTSSTFSSIAGPTVAAAIGKHLSIHPEYGFKVFDAILSGLQSSIGGSDLLKSAFSHLERDTPRRTAEFEGRAP